MNTQEIILEINGITKQDLLPEYQHLEFLELFKTLLSHKSVIVISDSDADGMCSARVWREYRKSNKDEIRFLDRSKRNPLDVMGLYAENMTYVFLDCASSEALPNAKNIYVIDHHESATRVENVNYLNPKMIMGNTTFCTATLLYSLFESATNIINSIALQYAAIAGIADMTPMLKDNRNIVSRGLQEMNVNPCDIVSEFKSYGKPYSESHIGFMIAPAMNAPSRMGKQDVAINAVVYADKNSLAELKTINNKRKTVVKNLIKDAKIDVRDNCVIAFIDAPNLSVTGLIANKLVSEYHKPVLCVNGNSFSMRSKNVDVENFVSHNSHMDGGGHKLASGGTINAEYINEIADSFDAYCSSFTKEEITLYDIFVDESSIMGFIDSINACGPYGQSYRKPICGMYGTIWQIGEDLGLKRIDSGYSKLKIKIGPYVIKAIIYDIESPIIRGNEYFIIFDTDYRELIIKGIENE